MPIHSRDQTGDANPVRSVVGREVEKSNDRTNPDPTSSKWRMAVMLLAIILLTSLWSARQAVTMWRDEAKPGNRYPDGASTATLAQLRSGTRGAAPPFELSNALVPGSEIRSGGPPKNGIPALTNPAYVKGSDAKYLKPGDRVIGYTADGESRAYPLKILNYHEVVNDKVGDQPIAVTYCPLCDSVAVFDRQTPIGLREFGVSGLLYNSNVLMYDRARTRESLWSQIRSEGISGPGASKRLRTLPVELTTWQEWLGCNPAL